MYGAFAWESRALSGPFRRFPARAVEKKADGKTAIRWWERVGGGRMGVHTKYKTGATERLATTTFPTHLAIPRISDPPELSLGPKEYSLS